MGVNSRRGEQGEEVRAGWLQWVELRSKRQKLAEVAAFLDPCLGTVIPRKKEEEFMARQSLADRQSEP